MAVQCGSSIALNISTNSIIPDYDKVPLKNDEDLLAAHPTFKGNLLQVNDILVVIVSCSVLTQPVDEFGWIHFNNFPEPPQTHQVSSTPTVKELYEYDSQEFHNH